jgi:hypothetical protein
MRVLRLVPAISFALFLVSCDTPPTALDDAAQLGATHLTDPSEWEMVQDWILWEGDVWLPCGNGGAGASFWFSQEIAGWGKVHVTPSGNFLEIAKVGFRNVQMRLGSPDGELYPFWKVVQQNIINQYQQDGRTMLQMADNEYYFSPDGRHLKLTWIWHFVYGGDGKPAEVQREMISCSPAKW